METSQQKALFLFAAWILAAALVSESAAGGAKKLVECAAKQELALELNEAQSKAVLAATKRLRAEYGDVGDFLIKINADDKEAYVSFIAIKADKSLPMYARLEGTSITYEIKSDGSDGRKILGR